MATAVPLMDGGGEDGDEFSPTGQDKDLSSAEVLSSYFDIFDIFIHDVVGVVL